MHSIILVTCPPESAEKLSEEILRLRLAACVNIVGPVRSRYWWRGNLESTEETLLIIKTRHGLFTRVEKAVRRLHPYKVPEIVEIRLDAGSRSYFAWLSRETPAIRRRPKRRSKS